MRGNETVDGEVRSCGKSIGPVYAGPIAANYFRFGSRRGLCVPEYTRPQSEGRRQGEYHAGV